MAPRKKQFACGHQGFGRFCHRCADEAAARDGGEQVIRARASERASWESSYDGDPINLRCLPRRDLVVEARRILADIAGGTDHRTFGGKLLVGSGRGFVSVPLGRRYRLVFRLLPGGGLEPHGAYSHEAYNRAVERL